MHHCRRAAEENGLRPPGSYREAAGMILLYASIAQTLATLDAGVYRADPERLAMAVKGDREAGMGRWAGGGAPP